MLSWLRKKSQMQQVHHIGLVMDFVGQDSATQPPIVQFVWPVYLKVFFVLITPVQIDYKYRA